MHGEYGNISNKSKLILSILIPSKNKDQLDQLLAILLPQLNDFQKQVEIIIDKEKISIGQKMNGLLEDAYGKYIWFIEESCLVSETAISDVFKAIESEPDMVNINGAFKIKDKQMNWKMGINELMKPRHIVPMKKEIALKIPFRKVSKNALDKWSKDMNRIKAWTTESVIEKPILLIQ